MVGDNIYKFGFISENIELVGMTEILGGVDLDTVPVCLRRCREFLIKVRVLSEGQTLLLVLEMAEVPKNLLNARIVIEHLWHRNQTLGGTSIVGHPRFTTIG